ncbi:MAG: LTA synthase family protein [Bacteroidetes bacterium]|nr:LTA synthase family protein [Bacteroidota bacterium]
MSISRVFWGIFNQEIFAAAEKFEIFMAILWGVFFDLPLLAYFFLPLWIWMVFFSSRAAKHPWVSRLLMLLGASPIIILNGIDTAYSRISGRRSGTELFSLFTDPANSTGQYIAEYWPGMLLLFAVMFLVYRFTPRGGLSVYNSVGLQWRRALLVFLTFVSVWIFSARGGFHLKPLCTLHAGLYVRPELTLLTVSTPLNIISMPGGEEVPEATLMDLKIAEDIVKPVFFGSRNTNSAHKHNIVLVIVESLGRDYTGFLNGKPYTPFLDTFSRHCINFRYCYANGTRSMEMVPSIFCGMPGMIETHYLNSGYAGNSMENAFNVFSKAGYSTAFFHGAANGTMFFQGFLQQTGRVRYYGRNEYPREDFDRDFDGNWGIFDEPYLHYFLKCCDTMKKPFFSAVFTLSSHHPYKVPAHLNNKFQKGKLPIHKSIRYADYALQSFFAKARQYAWFDNTLFVITGDHTSYGEEDYFYSPSGHFEIPLLFYGKNIKPKVADKTVSQCDIVPAIMDLTGVKGVFYGFGKNPFDSTYAGYSLHKEKNLYYIIRYPHVLGMDADGSVKDFHLQYRNRKKPVMLKKVGVLYDSLLLTLKAHVQLFTHNVRKNKWFIKQPGVK